MIHIENDKCNFDGNYVELATEIASVLGNIYRDLKNHDIRTAEDFKEIIIDIVKDDESWSFA